MTRILHAWLEGSHVGRFERADDGVVTFVYDDGAPETPISLPRDGSATRKAASNFLENLLPDHAQTRARMAKAYSATSPATFDVLARAGGDVAGGLVLLPDGQPFPDRDAPLLDPASDEDIATRIAAIKRDPDDWVSTSTPARFSLAGTQGKFALAEIDGQWYWSNASVPSTHIVKPARSDFPGLEAIEAAALGLANAAGVDAPQASVLVAIDQTAFLVERFDRAGRDPFAQRVHAEDIAQSLGRGPEKKYGVTAIQVVKLLRSVDATDELGYAFIRQLSFNTITGNADAHAKNYSVLLRPEGITLSPLYDSVPVLIYPEYDQKLAMRISGAERASQVAPEHWLKLGSKAGLHPDRVLGIASDVAVDVAEHVDAAWAGVDASQAEQLREGILRNTEKLTSSRK
ncbi:HipA domain-containing protein [Herbiconiux sp. CPCC 203407]|uniref:HipA domain-containing protein n=1 Tax=Herbiconiux oxytropis TaxID=2970915 RepID=A0AA41XJW1_9MICO|nr:HipA domain-containing protein [Herbiconiux oxytropis]MCS5723354.1 HipA domain-containing protein [Herbiconiux oxytropis]MCS5727533.1 HipA domain-containing protein [Herbiconiux oxytropis]